MKKLILTLAIFLFLTPVIFARIITIEAGPNGSRTFVPNSVTDAHVGDTIKWVWISGIHTTTSVTIPSGALAWDAPLTSSDPTFFYKITVPGTYNYKCTPHELMGMTGSFVASVSGIQQIGSIVNSFELKQNYPNPFNPATTINFSIPGNSFVSLNIYDTKGSLVANLVNENMNAGEYKFDFNAVNLASGIYLYRISAGQFTETKRMILLK
jgi:plastocyanin